VTKLISIVVASLIFAGNCWAEDIFDISRERSFDTKGNNRSYIETYAAGFLGVNFAQPLNEVHGTNGSLSAGIPMKSSFVYGGKLGAFSIDAPYVGAELEAYTSTPHTKQFSNLNAGPSGNAIDIVGANVRVTTVALNAILRYPGDRFQPYIGGGPALFILDASNGTRSIVETNLGFTALAGLKVSLTKHWRLFGEYKYNNASFNTGTASPIGLPGGRVDYEAHLLVGGIAFHFEP
jgi:opacity protein-like surface antigen